jgi:hypothetical protein
MGATPQRLARRAAAAPSRNRGRLLPSCADLTALVQEDLRVWVAFVHSARYRLGKREERTTPRARPSREERRLPLPRTGESPLKSVNLESHRSGAPPPKPGRWFPSDDTLALDGYVRVRNGARPSPPNALFVWQAVVARSKGRAPGRCRDDRVSLSRAGQRQEQKPRQGLSSSLHSHCVPPGFWVLSSSAVLSVSRTARKFRRAKVGSSRVLSSIPRERSPTIYEGRGRKLLPIHGFFPGLYRWRHRCRGDTPPPRAARIISRASSRILSTRARPITRCFDSASRISSRVIPRAA